MVVGHGCKSKIQKEMDVYLRLRNGLLIRGVCIGIVSWIRFGIMQLSQGRASQAWETWVTWKGRQGHLSNVYLTSSGSQDSNGFPFRGRSCLHPTLTETASSGFLRKDSFLEVDDN